MQTFDAIAARASGRCEFERAGESTGIVELVAVISEVREVGRWGGEPLL